VLFRGFPHMLALPLLHNKEERKEREKERVPN
jgi:hypothetical protein